jgi:adenylosuccinate synthase
MPTELLDDDGDRLREIGVEFGTTTGRKRRCGWFDALVVEAAAKANAFTDIFLTKLDVLTGWERIPVCVGYHVNGTRYETMPLTQSDFARAQPIYEEMDGWTEDISDCRNFDDLPKNTQAYVNRLEELCGARISGIGVGPSREQSIVINDLL